MEEMSGPDCVRCVVVVSSGGDGGTERYIRRARLLRGFVHEEALFVDETNEGCRGLLHWRR